MIKSRMMRWAVLVAYMSGMRNTQNFSCKSLKGRDHLESLGIDGKMILKLMFNK
jgi:hypothetical protein